LLFALSAAACSQAQTAQKDDRAQDAHTGEPIDLMPMSVDDLTASVVDLAPTMYPSDMSASSDLTTCPTNCDDGIACTVDVCVAATCQHRLDHSRCTDEEACTTKGCVPVRGTKLCSSCSSDSDCGADEVCGPTPTDVDGGTGKFCLVLCSQGTDCQKGFTCDGTMDPPRCVPDTICCIDSDGDRHGFGAGCLGGDCDDHEAATYVGNTEQCDNIDNNCNGQIDEGYLCPPPYCAEIMGTGTYSGRAISSCIAGVCSDEKTQPCGLYTCLDVTQPMVGSVCRTSCTGQEDFSCITPAYCNGSICTPRLPDGSSCNRDRVCTSNHCQNGHCCSGGDCCSIPADCPNSPSYIEAPVCEADADPLNPQCQGHRRDATCISSICGTAQVDDDSACKANITKDCSAFGMGPVACNGGSVQSPLACPKTCANDGQCVAGNWCQGAPTGNCVSKLPDGSQCGGDNQCLTGHHCLNNHCCNASSGACCGVASDCPDNSALQNPVCDSGSSQPPTCQGHHYNKACNTYVCGWTFINDDTACGSGISRTCGYYKDAHCNGALNQSNPLACPSSCTSDNDCITPANHCYNGQCVPWVENGGGCGNAAQCRSGTCWANQVCCSSACNNTACDTCWGGGCNYYSDYWETGSYCGSGRTVGSGAFDFSLNATIQNYGDREDWYWFYANDGNNACFWPINDYGYIDVTLTIPSFVDYDLYLYKWTGDCGTLSLIGSSTQGTGVTDHIHWQEDCGADDSGWYLVKVVQYYNYSCSSPYGLAFSVHV
jgi:hypothetical protein